VLINFFFILIASVLIGFYVLEVGPAINNIKHKKVKTIILRAGRNKAVINTFHKDLSKDRTYKYLCFVVAATTHRICYYKGCDFGMFEGEGAADWAVANRNCTFLKLNNG
jgi:hypothetical protein